MPSIETQLSKNEKIEALLQCFKHPITTYQRVMHLLSSEMDAGLRRDTNADADVKMFPTYVRSLPDGSESGTYLTLDLGGTNFRLLLVKIDGEDVSMKTKTYLIPPRIMLGTGVQLFDHIADCISHFVSEHGLSGRIPLSFTFSFPCKQEGLASARLSKWTKGFRCEGVVGRDVCQLLESAIKRRTTSDITCLAVVNDCVGTLMSTAHTDRSCHIGLVIGTGFNACYMERLEKIECWEGSQHHSSSHMIINTEWGAFGDNGCLNFIRTEYDHELDTYSVNPGKQVHEKMVSGMYIGEIARQVLERMANEGILFDSVSSDCGLFERGRFFTKYISEIENDRYDCYDNTKAVLNELNVRNFTTEDCKVVKYVCTLVSARAAFLAAAAIATLINRLGSSEVTVAVDGSLYRYHPRFHTLVKLKLQELVVPGLKFKLTLSNDGSGKGAAVVAAVAERLHQAASMET